MFGEDDVKKTHTLLPRLLRIIFFKIGITNSEYLERYRRYFQEQFPGKTRKEFSQKSVSDRKALMDKEKITFRLLQDIIEAMGMSVESVSLRLRDKLTGELLDFSTDMTVEEIKAELEKEKEIGVPGLI
jgi:hypothetical protein